MHALDAGERKVEVVDIARVVNVGGQDSSKVGETEVADFFWRRAGGTSGFLQGNQQSRKCSVFCLFKFGNFPSSATKSGA